MGDGGEDATGREHPKRERGQLALHISGSINQMLDWEKYGIKEENEESEVTNTRKKGLE